ncbi:MAG: GNAT family N-acetyltransferase [Ginsengibacter sp.]
MIFETERLYVRHLKKEDLDALHVLYSDPAIMEFIRPPLTKEETKKIFEEQLSQYSLQPQLGRYMIVEKKSDTFVGLFMLRKNEDKEGVEIGYSFRKQDWGKGYATEIVKKGVEYAFGFPLINMVYALTHQRNANSKNVLTKCGFIYQHDLSEDGSWSNLFSVVRDQGALKSASASSF